MSAGHTPGPWSVYGGGEPLIVVNSEGSSLGEMSAGDPFISMDTQRANARLTAAAPDLLEVAEDAISILEVLIEDQESWQRANGMEPDPDGPAHDLLARFRAAIAKATGIPQ